MDISQHMTGIMGAKKPVVEVGGYGVSKDLLLDLVKIREPYDQEGIHSLRAMRKQRLAHDWTLHMTTEDNNVGYGGALLSAEIDGKPHYFIYHEGSNDIKDIPSIARLANGKRPQQTDHADRFNIEAQEFIAKQHPGEDVPIIQVGYSLGGVLAMLVSSKEQPIISIEPPGTRKLMENIGVDTEQIGRRTLEILSPHPNIINSHGPHTGKVLIAGEKFWKTDEATVMDFIRMTIATHKNKAIYDGLKQMDTFNTTPAPELEYPTEAFDGFIEYLDDMIGENPSREERVLRGTAEVMDKIWLDKLLTRIIAESADRIAGKLTDGLSAITDLDAYTPHTTHPEVDRGDVDKVFLDALMMQEAVDIVESIEEDDKKPVFGPHTQRLRDERAPARATGLSAPASASLG